MQEPQAATEPQRDLFGEIPVTWDDVRDWTLAVAGIPPDSWRFDWYVQHWDVPGKVRAAKAAGTFYAALQATRRPRWTLDPPPGLSSRQAAAFRSHVATP